jgi:uncharacterized phage protein (TIGR01671 family)
MDRDLYRGKQVDTGKWVQGYYLHCNPQDKDYILTGEIATYQADAAHPHMGIESFEWIEIDSGTKGQCTGLRDKENVLVFEGDILSCPILRLGGQSSNWSRNINQNHGKTHHITMQMKWKQKERFQHSLGEWVLTKVDDITDAEITDIERPIGKERTTQQVNYFNIKVEECKIVGNIHDTPLSKP